MFGFGRSRREILEVSREANFSAKHTSSQEDPRVSHPDADASWPRGDFPPQGQGSGAPLRVARSIAPVGARSRVSRERLTSPQEFRRVLREGRSRGAGGLVVHVRERGCQRDRDGEARLGFVVPRAVGTAVQRNRVKRQIRSAWRDLRADIVPSVDCVVVVRDRAVGAAYADLVHHLETCLRSVKVLGDRNPVSVTAGTP